MPGTGLDSPFFKRGPDLGQLRVRAEGDLGVGRGTLDDDEDDDGVDYTGLDME